MSRSSQRGVVHILLLVVLLAGLAFGVYLVQQRTNLFSRASSRPLSGPILGSNYISWGTQYVSLKADDFYIEIDGTRYYADNSSLQLTSNPTTTLDDGRLYTTLEARWQENAREMRFNLYFYSEGGKWTNSEMRTYDGKSPGDWIHYGGLTTKTGPVKIGDNLESIEIFYGPGPDLNSGEEIDATIYFRSLRLQAFLDQRGPVIDLPAPLPDIPVPPIFYPVPDPGPTTPPAPQPTPTLAPGANNWGADTHLVCQNGATPQRKERTRLVYAVWPDEPYDLNNPVKFKRTEFSYDDPEVQVISITNKLSVSSGYVGIETQSGQFLAPTGRPQDDDLEYGNFFGVNMVRWYKNELPRGYYNIAFEAPASWCK